MENPPTDTPTNCMAFICTLKSLAHPCILYVGHGHALLSPLKGIWGCLKPGAGVMSYLETYDSFFPNLLFRPDSCNMSVFERECPICLEVSSDPILTPCFHSMCYECAKDWLSRKAECPTCCHPMTLQDVARLAAESDHGISTERSDR